MTTADAFDGLPKPRRYYAALGVSMAVTVSVLDGSMVVLAAPLIARDLGIDAHSAIWVVSAYQLSAAMAMLPVGRLADSLGRRRVYLACVAMFMLGALGAAFASNLMTLATARFVQGLGGAGLMGVTNAMLRDIYPRETFGRGLGLNAAAVAISVAVGPTLAALILAVAPWQALFLITTPIGALLLVLGWFTFPPDKPVGGALDLTSTALAAVAFGATLSAANGVAHGEAVLLIALATLIGASAWIVLTRRARNEAAPLLPLDLMGIRPFTLSLATLFSSSLAQLMAYVAIPFMLQHEFARTPLETGLLFGAWPLTFALAAAISGRLAARFSPGAICTFGLGLLALGLALLALLSPQASAADIVWRMAVCGLGYGLFQPPNARALITSAPLDRAGAANSMGAGVRIVGQATGAAVVALTLRLAPEQGAMLALWFASAAALASAAISSMRGARA